MAIAPRAVARRNGAEGALEHRLMRAQRLHSARASARASGRTSACVRKCVRPFVCLHGSLCVCTCARAGLRARACLVFFSLPP